MNGYKKPYCYPIPVEREQVVKDKIDEMLEQGIIRRSSSRYMSPILVVPKKDGRIRLCVDYRNLNAVTIPDNFVLPRIDRLKLRIHGKVFSTIDLKDGFMQIPIAEEDIPKTAMYTPWGLYEYLRMPFGLRNAPPTFQRFMNMVLHRVEHQFCYIDDIIVFSETLEDHKIHLGEVFARLAQYGLVINLDKSHFVQSSAVYLGFEFSASGYRPLESHTLKIQDFPVPTSKKELQSFLGALQYYRSHIPGLAFIASPLYDLTKGKGRKFIWTDECQHAFESLKELIGDRCPLAPLKPDGDYALYTDASGLACGAVLTQDGNVVEFYSKTFSPVEQRYSCHEREALAMVIAILHFKQILLGVPFTLYTDHRSLQWWFLRPPVNERHARWIVKIQDMIFRVVHIDGKENVLADLMSRPGGLRKATLEELHDHLQVNAITTGVDPDKFRLAQNQEFVSSCKLKPEDHKVIDGFHYSLESGHPRLLVPPCFQQEIVRQVHDLGHFGRGRTYKTVQKSYYWPGMPRTVKETVRACQICQRYKKTRPIQRDKVPFPRTDRLKTVHIDIVGPLPRSSNDRRYVLTMMDRFSRWFEAVPLNDITAAEVAEKFYRNWICRFGAPDILVSDQGTQFESSLFNEVLRRLGIDRRRIAPYHPQANGLIERAHSTFKNSLKCIADKVQCWEKALPTALLAMRCAVTDLGVSPALVLYGEQLQIPGCFLPKVEPRVKETIWEFVDELQENIEQVRQHLMYADPTLRGGTCTNRTFPLDNAFLVKPVLKDCLSEKLQGPYPVIRFRFPNVTLRTERGDKTYNMDMVRGAYQLPEPIPDCMSDGRYPALVVPKPPVRGCPIKASNKDVPASDATTNSQDSLTPSSSRMTALKNPRPSRVKSEVVQRGTTRTLTFPLNFEKSSIVDKPKSLFSDSIADNENKRSVEQSDETSSTSLTVDGLEDPKPVVTRSGRIVRPPERLTL